MSVLRHSDRSAAVSGVQDVTSAASSQCPTLAHDGSSCVRVKNTGCRGDPLAYFTEGWSGSTILENVLYNLKMYILLIFLANYCVACCGRQQVDNGGNLDMNEC